MLFVYHKTREFKNSCLTCNISNILKIESVILYCNLHYTDAHQSNFHLGYNK